MIRIISVVLNIYSVQHFIFQMHNYYKWNISLNFDLGSLKSLFLLLYALFLHVLVSSGALTFQCSSSSIVQCFFTISKNSCKLGHRLLTCTVSNPKFSHSSWEKKIEILIGVSNCTLFFTIPIGLSRCRIKELLD